MAVVARVVLSLIALKIGSSWKTLCPQDCNGHGACSKAQLCECFVGYESPDCSLRVCPSGMSWFDIASNTDTAHAAARCSNAGRCDPTSGSCVCDTGYEGQTCERSKCPRRCSGHGQCLSMEDAAAHYDGSRLNHTALYNLWDASRFYGCVCDDGFGGYDCSQRVCAKGTSPFNGDSNLPGETVLLECACSSSCSGTFKLRFERKTSPYIPTR
jgi:hypothetical protein